MFTCKAETHLPVHCIFDSQSSSVSMRTLLKLKRPLYGFADADEYWHTTIQAHIENRLKMKETTLYPALYRKLVPDGDMVGISIAHVDRTISTWKKGFPDKTGKTAKLFVSYAREFDIVLFAGVELNREGGNILIFA